MEKYFEQMKEYLNMDTEIPYEEFEAYYQDVVAFLNSDYLSLNREDAVKGRFIMSILMSNSQDRAKRYKNLAKKYKKIYDKCQLWAEALTIRLLKMGMTKNQIIQAEQALHDAI
ncbi:hypothetical protein [Desulforamulus hydrothermalis]|uniref:Uncharacterized protein n=1 Tax=Desulforamulus hydrothermalis Lam5 = DSM 18033 TaxID=1121428 RepID=K8DYY5_9FIRM|nr:hypothetical protein [Desulforamulus hydrothermalis]CCO08192.1 conserved hypothetical protein [Desulforamulus hydrothermalis Lam5 = DSM 18033]SHH22808.1 hypothetical protein SAMN02745177_01890 [Desulforamulus hydrothermalis Lam5 = DSM 18033]